jgi:hypothetical protein
MISEHATPIVKTFQLLNIEIYHPAIQTALKGLRWPSDDEDEDEIDPNALDDDLGAL